MIADTMITDTMRELLGERVQLIDVPLPLRNTPPVPPGTVMEAWGVDGELTAVELAAIRRDLGCCRACGFVAQVKGHTGQGPGLEVLHFARSSGCRTCKTWPHCAAAEVGDKYSVPGTSRALCNGTPSEVVGLLRTCRLHMCCAVTPPK